LLVRRKLLEITTELDHYVLLPTQHPTIRVEDYGREVTATFAERRWVFPSGDCRLLPVPNTTSELLAAYIGKRLFDALGGAAAKIERITLKVDECDGQVGVWVHRSTG
jgi:6-pyruvoyltetrahydropterin/6-carboxytetrahydropterin synthase